MKDEFPGGELRGGLLQRREPRARSPQIVQPAQVDDAGRRTRPTAPWRTSTAWAAARPPCSRDAGGMVAGVEARADLRGRPARPRAQAATARLSACRDPELEQGWVDAELAEEFPDLASVDARAWTRGSGRSAATSCASACACMASRITGGHVIHMRQDPVPWAYRVFWRQVGIDPDTDRTPVEQIALDRLQARAACEPEPAGRRDHDRHAGDRRARDRVRRRAGGRGELGLRAHRRRRAAGRIGPPAVEPPDRDRRRATTRWRSLVRRGGRGARRHADRPRAWCSRSIQVKGVPLISVEEALWTVVEIAHGARAERPRRWYVCHISRGRTALVPDVLER